MRRFLGNDANALIAGFLVSLIVFALWTYGVDKPLTSVNGDPRSTLADLVYGRAHNPFVQRMLVPAITRAAMASLPATTNQWLNETLSRFPRAQRALDLWGWDDRYLAEHLVAFSIAFLSLVLFVPVFRSMVEALYITEGWVSAAVACASLLFLPPFFLAGTHYVYDFPAMLFFTTGIVLLLRSQWKWYYAVFALGCLNKETMVFLLVPFLLITWDRLSRRALAAHAVAHLGIFALVKSALMVAFAANPGGTVEFHFWTNLHDLLMPYTMTAAVIAFLALFLLLFDLRNKPPALRRAAWAGVPFLIVTLCFGLLAEVRVFLEVFPVFFLLISHTVLFTFGRIPFALRAEARV